MADNYELIGRDVLVVKRYNPSSFYGFYQTAFRLSSIVRWDVDDIRPETEGQHTCVELVNGTIFRGIMIPFDEFTKIIAMPLAASLGVDD